MRTRPADLPDALIRATVGDGWALETTAVEHRPVGFGSHHWSIRAGDGTRWFLTVDDLDAKQCVADDDRDAARSRLRNALIAARAARDASADFVVAPIPTRAGQVLHELSDRYAAALYPHIDGRTDDWGQERSDSDRAAVLELLVRLHTLPEAVAARADPDEPTVPHRHELERAIDDLGERWTAGPHAGAARALLDRHAAGVVRMLAHHDRLASRVRARPDRLVLTHGEPHPGNTIHTSTGPLLVDWDTARRAPPERDLWMLGDDAATSPAYETATGRTVLAEVMELYRLDWDLSEIAIYIRQFRSPHGDSADERIARFGLEEHLDPAGRWPQLR
ncbi:MAG: phosphotransferase [Actinomycetota bacterium]|nr:phosphotransferase [Actinomycetota bacterium]